IEQAIAGVWAELLGVERVGRFDDFFALGGHSLLAVSLVERLREREIATDVRTVFAHPTVAALAEATVTAPAGAVEVPANLIGEDTAVITPDLLPLVELSQEQIDRVVAQIPGGTGNVQDIYPLAPLQEGMLFHHLMSPEHDVYVLSNLLAIDTRENLDGFLAALQTVIDRHDVLRTSFHWEGLPQPVQVVHRRPALALEEIELDPDGDAARQLTSRNDSSRFRMDLTTAPPLRVLTGYDAANDRWLLLVLMHHIVDDHSTMERLLEEIGAVLSGRHDLLPEPVPYRNVVAQAVLGVSEAEHEAFFTGLLGDVEEPCVPYGVLDVHGDGSDVAEAEIVVDAGAAEQIRALARREGVSAASLFHLAWALVLARLTGRDDVVFGTVLFGRMHGGSGADRGVGLFINTLPVRVRPTAGTIGDGIRGTHRLLTELIGHEHAPLGLAQRCSGVPAGAPLFTTLLNYRHGMSAVAAADAAEAVAWAGVTELGVQARTNYPVLMSVDEFDDWFLLSLQAQAPIDADRMLGLLVAALHDLADGDTGRDLAELDVLPEAERHRVVEEFNATGMSLPSGATLHGLFAERAAETPDAVAVIDGGGVWSYGALDMWAWGLAERLSDLGVRAGERVAVVMDRSVALVAAELAVLRLGAVCVPIDPAGPQQRMRDLLVTSGVRVALTAPGLELPDVMIVRVDVDPAEADGPVRPVPVPAVADDTGAYVLFTSGSTGTPKGVLLPHRALVRLVVDGGVVPIDRFTRTAFVTSPTFDMSVLELWGPLVNGGSTVVVSRSDLLDPEVFADLLIQHEVSMMWLTVGLFHRYAPVMGKTLSGLRHLFVGGDVVNPEAVGQLIREHAADGLINGYGPTEATLVTTYRVSAPPSAGRSVPIGRPLPNNQVYLLDDRGRPLPVGAVGELYVGGAGVAQGYLDQPVLTAGRFVPHPFDDGGARVYRTGDLGRWLPDGTIEFLGRNDHQVKIRGFRVELGEIEARLLEVPGVEQVSVVARADAGGDRQLVAYHVPAEVDGANLREHLAAVLPGYMVPAAFVGLDRLPLNKNGKVDRAALPAPDSDAFARAGYQEPQGAAEQTIAAVWAELLGVERVGRFDDFFVLGGHSLTAVTLVERLREHGLPVDVRTVFTHPTVADLAASVGTADRLVEVPDNLIPDIGPDDDAGLEFTL
ncbi:non-ribosomal peptide synthetase, partial [Nonomuraea diastatica]